MAPVRGQNRRSSTFWLSCLLGFGVVKIWNINAFTPDTILSTTSVWSKNGDCSRSVRRTSRTVRTASTTFPGMTSLFVQSSSREGEENSEEQQYVETKADTNENAKAKAEVFQERAQQLRDEIKAFQSKKDALEQEERQQIEEALKTEQDFIDQYSCSVPILKPDGSTVEETIQFPPRYESGTSRIVTLEAPLPLGLILGEMTTEEEDDGINRDLEGMTCVDEVAVGSNGESAGFQVGDLIRACTACQVEMEQPTWQLVVGGIGRPKTMRFIFSADFKPFEQIMDALGSNRMDPEERSVIVVVERKLHIADADETN